MKTPFLAIALATAASIASAQSVKPAQKKAKPSPVVDAALETYKRAPGVSGNLSSVGSDTLNNLMTLWAESYKKFYPSVRIQIEGKGSSTAPPALIEGVAQFGPMSRRMKKSEIDKFDKKFGYKPTEIKAAVDALAVFVHKDNPVKQITLQELDAIFSKNRKGGHKKDITTWGQLGAKGAWATKPIRLYGRNSASGTYGYFKKVALFKGDYKSSVKEQPGSASVVRSIEADPYGIGYSGIGYKTSGVKTLSVAKKPGMPFYGTETKTVLKGKYPLSRFLYIYINKAPNRACEPLVREFVRFVLSKQGQTIVVKDGYLPIRAKLAAKMLGEISSAAQ